MRDIHDIEGFIKMKVEDHVSDVPPHIWDNIQSKRSYPHTIMNFFRVRWRSTGFLIALLGLLMGLLIYQQGQDSSVIQSNDSLKDSEWIENEKETSHFNDTEPSLEANADGITMDGISNSDSWKADNSTIEENDKMYVSLNKGLDVLLFGRNTGSYSSKIFPNDINDTQKDFSTHNSKFNSVNSTPSTSYSNTKIDQNSENANTENEFLKKERQLMELNKEWVQSAYASKGRNKNYDYPHGPPIKYSDPIVEDEYRILSVDDYIEELEVIPMQENVLRVRDVSTDRTEVEEDMMTAELLEKRLGAKKERVKKKEVKEKKTPPRKPKKKKENQWLWIDLVTSPNYIIKNLSPYRAEGNAYLNERLKTEESRFGYTLGFRTSFRLHDVSEIRTGLLYSKITENFVYQRPAEIDPLTGEEITFDLETATNKYQFVDIPILIGYREDRKNFDFNVNFGILLNLSFSQHGLILNPSDELTTLALEGPLESPIFKKNSGLALFGSIGYNYKLSKNVHLLLEPSLRYTVRPVNHWEYPLRQRFHTFGVTTGLRVNIGN